MNPAEIAVWPCEMQPGDLLSTLTVESVEREPHCSRSAWITFANGHRSFMASRHYVRRTLQPATPAPDNTDRTAQDGN